MFDNDDIVLPITPVTLNPIRRIQPSGYKPTSLQSKRGGTRKASKKAPSKSSTKKCIVTAEKVDCNI